MMTKRERNRIADELLCAAKLWQNGSLTASLVIGDWVLDYYDPRDTLETFSDNHESRLRESASAALSEAARLADTELVDAETGK